MVEARQEICLKVVGDKLYIRLVNHKQMKQICEILQIPLEHEDNPPRIYIDIMYIDNLILGLVKCNKIVRIIS